MSFSNTDWDNFQNYLIHWCVDFVRQQQYLFLGQNHSLGFFRRVSEDYQVCFPGLSEDRGVDISKNIVLKDYRIIYRTHKIGIFGTTSCNKSRHFLNNSWKVSPAFSTSVNVTPCSRTKIRLMIVFVSIIAIGEQGLHLWRDFSRTKRRFSMGLNFCMTNFLRTKGDIN